MDISYWSLSQILAKSLLYFGFAAGIGGPFILFLTRDNPALCRAGRRYSLGLILAAMAAATSLFFLQVGALSDTGIGGMADSLMRELVWNTNAGPALLYQLGGLACLLLTALMSSTLPAGWLSRVIVGGLFIGGAALLGGAFAIVGHTTELNTLVKGLLAIHVVAMAWWLGSLWPLRRACVELDQTGLYRLMRRFSQCANAVVALLLVCGLVLAWQLLESWRQLFTTAYGRVLLIKLSAVALILGLAAWHKWGLTEKLLQDDVSASRWLRRSIGLEIGLAGIILTITAILTTVVGPGHSLSG